MKKRVVVVGGGASGLVAGIFAAREGAEVTVLEHMDRVGKKILSTGNGKCNLTNLNIDKGCYRGDQERFSYEVLGEVSVEETLEFFKGIGIFFKDRNGAIYPRSEQASSVLDVLRMEAEFRKVRMICGSKVTDVKRSRKRQAFFDVATKERIYEADVVILACGSKAAPACGSDGSGYELAKGLGHRVIKPLPALVQLRGEGNYFKQLAGIRTEVALRLLGDGTELCREKGELQLTDYGISGIVVFQVSRFASKALEERKRVEVMVDFIPELSCEELELCLRDRRSQGGYKRCEEYLTGMLNKKLAWVLMRCSGIELKRLVKELDNKELMKLVKQMKEFRVVVKETNSFTNAQVCAGGVDTKEIYSSSLESRLVKNLYIVGELLDVDGICGGYNLQWAWSTGIIAGRNAGRG